MPKLKLEQGLPESRDIGGLSSTALLAVAVGLSVIWALLLHHQIAGFSHP